MDYAIHILTTAAMLLFPVLGYNLVLGRGKILHFGPVAVSIAAVYAIVVTEKATGSYALGIAVGALCSLGVGMLFAWLALRLESDGFGIMTIALHLAALAIVLNWTNVTRGALGIPQIPRMAFLQSPASFAFVVTSLAVVWVLLMLRLDRSSLGRALTALSENRAHAESLGISRIRTYVLAFIVASAGSLLSGIFYPQYIGLLHPSDYTFPWLVFLVMCVVAGGPGRVIGVTIATILLTILKEGLRFLPIPLGIVGPVRLLLFGIILIVAVYIRRKELFPQARTV